VEPAEESDSAEIIFHGRCCCASVNGDRQDNPSDNSILAFTCGYNRKENRPRLLENAQMESKNWEEIEATLREEIDKKRAAYQKAKQRFDVAIIPSGIAYPDGVLNIKNAGAGHTMAVSAYRQALMEYHHFTFHGIIPNRFKLVGLPHRIRPSF
jgi:hypothetical protein